MKDEREVINRGTIAKKLIRESKRSAIGTVIFMFLGALLFALPGLIFSDFPIGKTAVGILCAIFVVVCLIYIIRALIDLSRANGGRFTVVEDCLKEVEDNKFSFVNLLTSRGFFSRQNFNHVFKFASGKIFVANSETYRNTSIDAAATFSVAGDSFFVVAYEAKPNKIIWIYSAKLFNYKE